VFRFQQEIGPRTPNTEHRTHGSTENEMGTMNSDDRTEIRSQLRTMARELGAKAFGVADLDLLKKDTPDLLALVPGEFCRAVVIGMRLQDSVVEGIVDRPTPLYFHNYRQTNYRLDRAAIELADMIQNAGYAALAVPASQIVARDPMRGHVSHRRLGYAAGLGFIGRNCLLVSPKYGARMRYVSVLTDARLEPDGPIDGTCGSCRRCIDVCPAGAIGETSDEFDLDKCYRKLSEFTRLSFIGQHVCGVCVRACSGGGNRGT